MSAARILVLCQGLPVLTLIAEGLKSRGYGVTVAQEVREVPERWTREPFDLVVLKWSPESEAAGALERFRPPTKLVVLCEAPEMPAEHLWERLAALIFLPCRPVHLWRRVKDCLKRLEGEAAGQQAKAQLPPVHPRVCRQLAAVFSEMTTSVLSLAFHMDLLRHRVRNSGNRELEELCNQAGHRNQLLWEIMREMRDSFTRIKPLTKLGSPRSFDPGPLGPCRLL